MAKFTHDEVYTPKLPNDKASTFGHSGSDYICIDEFVKKINGDKDADIIDIYEALDSFLPGMFAYRSILEGGKTIEIPNLRDKEVREIYRNDTACTDPKVAGDMLLPTFSLGTPDIPDKVYETVKEKWEDELKNGGEYLNMATTQGAVQPGEKSDAR